MIIQKPFDYSVRFFISDDLPLTAAISLPLYALLRQKLQHHLAQVLRQATSVSEVMCCNPSLMEAYRQVYNNRIEHCYYPFLKLWAYISSSIKVWILNCFYTKLTSDISRMLRAFYYLFLWGCLDKYLIELVMSKNGFLSVEIQWHFRV